MIAARVGIGQHGDGGLAAVTGAGGLSVQATRRFELRLTGITDAALDAWGVRFGPAARL